MLAHPCGRLMNVSGGDWRSVAVESAAKPSCSLIRCSRTSLWYVFFSLKNPGLFTPAARLIALDQSGRAEAAASVIDSAENGFLYVSLMVGAPGSYYLVFLVPGAGNLILYPRFFF